MSAAGWRRNRIVSWWCSALWESEIKLLTLRKVDLRMIAVVGTNRIELAHIVLELGLNVDLPIGRQVTARDA